MNLICRVVVVFILAWTNSAQAIEKLGFMVELGAVWQHRNDIQIPGETGIRVAADELDEGPFFHSRLEGSYTFNDSHGIRWVLAPFTVKVDGDIASPVVFDGATFGAGQPLEVEYTFNSYRLSYVYAYSGFGSDQFNIGFTGKIRDAKTTFSQPGQSSFYSNVGFVPLFYFEYQKGFGSNYEFNITSDLAAAPQGRAIDVALKLRRELSSNSKLGVGLRSLEGGADNEKVFTFSWFNYFVLDYVYHF